MHYLQELFVTQHGEAAWTDEMHALFAVGDLAAAEAVLAEALAGLGSELGALCLALTPERVVLAGWEELDEAIALHEGDPVTGITIAIANEYDRAFEKGELHRPYVTLGIYTDEGFAFSRADGATIFAELDKEYPDWSGYEEDIEVHLDIEGLDALNTALLHHKQRHFFRDERPPQAPLRYVEYVLGCWWRALLWQQAVARACALTGLPGAIPVVCGMVEMKPEVVSLHVADGYAGPRARSVRAARAPLAEAGFGEGFIRRRTLPVEEAPPTGLELRRRASAAAAAAQQAAARPDAAPGRPRLFGRLFGPR
jgi:hypothetical protein